jgi:phosphoribosylformylglycinamidine synthase
LEGDFNVEQLEKIAETILVDPVVETFTVQADAAKAKKGKVKEWVVDVWPKTGVTDPVGETVETALKDFGLKGPARASSGNRYQFPKIKDPKNLKILAKKFLANELIHDIDIRKPN